ncbi:MULTISPECIES: hypothetical protein [Limnochorda]|uniref:hypothetical protein n=1 Tax=Limnochorda TaxID=1676651 RepID=UPI00178E6749|nr:hypothetical protein [Limnochorda pilosa]MBO2487143.1 hypothetical protein [Bacillota bacterium]MBO2518373.1 hypothetical protein [Bacillota bacterium]NMA71037.1 hypothetical protein [Bacillota bacterium]
MNSLAFSLGVVAAALWEGLRLWQAGLRREAAVTWALWGLGLVLGNVAIHVQPGFSLILWINQFFKPVGRLLTGP